MNKETAQPNTEKRKRGRPAGKVTDTQKAKTVTAGIKERTASKPRYTNPILLAYRIASYMYSQDQAVTEMASGVKRGKPYTISGARAAASFIDESDWFHYIHGELDHIITEQAGGQTILSMSGVQSFHMSQVPNHLIPYVLYLLDIHLEDYEPYNVNPGQEDPKEDIQLSAETLELLNTAGKAVFFSSILQKYALLVQSQRESDLYDKGRTSDIFIHKARYGWQDEQRITFTRNIIAREEARELLEMVARLPEIE